MFDKTLKRLEEEEAKRRIERVDFTDFFTTQWEVEDFGLPTQLYVMDNGLKISRHAWWEVCDKIKRTIKGRDIPAQYLWENPRVVKSEMQRHVTDQNILHHSRKLSKRDHNDVLLNIHDNVITAIFSTNYVDLSNLDVLRTYAENADINDLKPIAVSVKFKDQYLDQMEAIITYEQFTRGSNLYSAGILIRNSQNGTYSVHYAPITKSMACDNSILSYFSHHKRHTVGVGDWYNKLMPSTSLMIQNAVLTYNNYMKADNYRFEDFDQVQEYIKSLFRLTKPVMGRFIEGLRSERTDIEGTLFNLISALTYAAQYDSVTMQAQEMRMLRYAAQLLELVGTHDGTIISLDAIKEA